MALRASARWSRRSIGPLRVLCALLVSSSLLSPALQAAPPKRGRITGLRVRSDDAGSVVEVQADRPLSFTTLRLAAPPRVVLDFPDAEVDGAPREQEIEDGTVRRVGAAAVGARTARVVIELSSESEFDVRAVGPRLDVRIPRSPSVGAGRKPSAAPAAVASAAPVLAPPAPPGGPGPSPSAPDPAAPPARAADVAAERGASEQSSNQQPAAADAAAAQSSRVGQAAVQKVAEDAGRQRLGIGLGAEAKAATEAAAEVAERASAEKQATQEQRAAAAKRAAEEQRAAAAKRAAAEQQAAVEKRAAEEQQAAAQRWAADERQAAAEKQAEADQRAATAKRAAAEQQATAERQAVIDQQAAAGKATQAAEGREALAKQAAVERAAEMQAAEERAVATAALAAPSPAPGVEVDPRKALPTVSLAGQSSRPRPPVPAEPAAPRGTAASRAEVHAPRAPHAAEPAHASEPGRVLITGIGFHPRGGGSVLVRSERPLEFGVTGEDRVVLVHLKGAELRRPNDRLPLDTRFFGGVVERVVPLVVPGGIDLRIELRGPSAYQVQQGDGVLSVTFAPQ